MKKLRIFILAFMLHTMNSTDPQITLDLTKDNRIFYTEKHINYLETVIESIQNDDTNYQQENLVKIIEKMIENLKEKLAKTKEFQESENL